MIPFNELRIGNWVGVKADQNTDFHYSKIILIDAYTNSIRVSIDGEDNGMGCGIEDIDPIPITPEILRTSKHWGKWGDGTWTDGHCDYQYNFETKMFSTHSEVDGSGWGLKKIEYVHDFQNLYFALTGTELDCKL